jgi:hypothetical protein
VEGRIKRNDRKAHTTEEWVHEGSGRRERCDLKFEIFEGKKGRHGRSSKCRQKDRRGRSAGSGGKNGRRLIQRERRTCV